METVFNSFVDLQKSFAKVMPLAAIWLNKPVKTSAGTTVRIEEGMKIRVENDSIEDIEDDKPATHIIKECFGNVANSILEIEVENLETKVRSTIKLK